MAEQKLRRKTFLVTAGAMVLGWFGARAGTSRSTGLSEPSAKAEANRVKQEPRAVPCTGKGL